MATALSVLLGAGATALSNRTSATDEVRAECARVEAAFIHDALTDLGYPSERGRGMHRRLGTMWPTGRVDRVIKASLEPLTCPVESAERRARRHAFGIDPWGNAYWVRIERDTSGSARLRVYSFGANRRRDHDHIGGALGDDVVADSATRR